MTDFPSLNLPPPFISTWSMYSALREFYGQLQGEMVASSVTWGAGNTAKYIPVTIPFIYPVNRVFWVNGATITAKNNDFGIYTMQGMKIYSTGSTAQAGANVPQYVTPGTPFLLYPGDYYFAFNCSAASGGDVTGHNNTFVVGQRMSGIKQQAVGSTPLPASATFAAVTVAGVPLCGITWTTTGF
jgi:hypothetical protein